MKEWKANQILYHRLTNEHSDASEKFTHHQHPDIQGEALRYLQNPREESIYPGKSYAVALIYARLLRDHFDEDFYEVLNDPDLLFGNDPHFVPYEQAKAEYDGILEALGGPDCIPLTGRWVDYTVRYFKDECMAEAVCFKT